MSSENNYLTHIEFCAKFNDIEELKGEDADYSMFNDVVEKNFPKALCYLENSHPFIPDVDKTWMYQIKDIKNIRINYSSITISWNGKYFRGPEDLKEDIKKIINILDELCLWEDLIISLRYVNEITPESVDDWSEWINPQLHNFNFKPDNSKLMRSLTRAEYEIDDFHFVFQYGQYNMDYPSTFIRNDFVLDYECIRPDGCDIYLIKHDFRKMNKIIYDAYKKSIEKMLK